MELFRTLEAALDQKIREAVNKALSEAEDGRSIESIADSLRDLEGDLERLSNSTEDYDRRLASLEEGDGFNDAFRDFLSRNVTVTLEVD